MAWISVHQQVNGAKLRSLAKRIGCSRHEALGILVTLWMWGLDNANEEGFVINADEDDIADAITIGLSGGINPANVVDALIKTGWIDYRDGKYILHDWDEWQAPWYKYKEKRQKETERKRDFRRRQSAPPPEPQAPPEKPPSPPPAHITPGLGSELTEEDLKWGDELEGRIMPGIEAICRSVGMSFNAYDDQTVRDLLMTYSADEIAVAIPKAAEQGKARWAYIKGILKNGGGKRDGSGSAAGSPSQARQGRRSNEDRPGKYGLESTKV